MQYMNIRTCIYVYIHITCHTSSGLGVEWGRATEGLEAKEDIGEPAVYTYVFTYDSISNMEYHASTAYMCTSVYVYISLHSYRCE